MADWTTEQIEELLANTAATQAAAEALQASVEDHAAFVQEWGPIVLYDVRVGVIVLLCIAGWGLMGIWLRAFRSNTMGGGMER